jgi:2-methylisocitrate lyase-like PEP mutase family enzyme
MTGFGTAAARGLPDLGMLTMSEMVDNARIIARAVEIPVVCDADTGYGGPLNVMRTVHEYEAAGAAAIHLEDQVWPKRCGFLEGKEVVPAPEMVGKIRAAIDARSDRDFVIIARTDALQVEGWSGAEQRARAYVEAGADLIFVDGIRTAADLDEYATCLADAPRVYNGQLEPASSIADRGFSLMLHTASLAAAFVALRTAMDELAAKGTIASSKDARIFGEILQVLEVPQALELAERYGG